MTSREFLHKLILIFLLIPFFNTVYSSLGRLGNTAIFNSASNKYEVNMTIVNELNEGGGAKDIEIVGDIAYVLSDSGLNIYNVADPENASELGHYYSDGYLGHSIAVYNGFVFAAADDRGLKIINVTTPSHPTLANTYTSTRPAAIYIQNNLLVIANWENDFEVYNISNVPLITELNRFIGDGFYYVYAKNELSFAFANNGTLLIVDINNLEKIGQINDYESSCIAVDENFWYIGGSNGIKVFNSTKKSEPMLMSHLPEIETSYITNLAIFDGFLYASDFHQGFRLFEISDSISLMEIGRNSVGGSPLGFQVVGEIAYVASQIRGIEIIKIQINEIGTDSSSIDEETYFGTEFFLLSIIILGFCSRRRINRKK